MSRYDVYRAPKGELACYVLDVQSDLVGIMATRAVIPLFVQRDYTTPIAVLNPRFEIEGEVRVMATHLIATVETSYLGERVTSLSSEHFTVVAALDKLFSGY